MNNVKKFKYYYCLCLISSCSNNGNLGESTRILRDKGKGGELRDNKDKIQELTVEEKNFVWGYINENKCTCEKNTCKEIFTALMENFPESTKTIRDVIYFVEHDVVLPRLISSIDKATPGISESFVQRNWEKVVFGILGEEYYKADKNFNEKEQKILDEFTKLVKNSKFLCDNEEWDFENVLAKVEEMPFFGDSSSKVSDSLEYVIDEDLFRRLKENAFTVNRNVHFLAPKNRTTIPEGYFQLYSEKDIKIGNFLGKEIFHMLKDFENFEFCLGPFKSLILELCQSGSYQNYEVCQKNLISRLLEEKKGVCFVFAEYLIYKLNGNKSLSSKLDIHHCRVLPLVNDRYGSLHSCVYVASSDSKEKFLIDVTNVVEKSQFLKLFEKINDSITKNEISSNNKDFFNLIANSLYMFYQTESFYHLDENFHPCILFTDKFFLPDLAVEGTLRLFYPCTNEIKTYENWDFQRRFNALGLPNPAFEKFKNFLNKNE